MSTLPLPATSLPTSTALPSSTAPPPTNGSGELVIKYSDQIMTTLQGN